MNMQRLAVFNNQSGHFDVYIGSSCYEMDENPMPNGINIYSGEYDPPDSNDNFLPPDKYSDGLKRNIIKRL